MCSDKFIPLVLRSWKLISLFVKWNRHENIQTDFLQERFEILRATNMIDGCLLGCSLVDVDQRFWSLLPPSSGWFPGTSINIYI
jgi:hypothetical protein